MGKTYSLDLRESAVAAVIAAGQPQAAVARSFGIGLATLSRWLACWRQGESLTPKAPQPGPAGFFAEAGTLTALEAQVAAAPDDRLDDHCHTWQAATGKAGQSCDDGPRHRPAGVDTQKKRLLSAERDEAERAAWREAHAGLDPAQIVSVDESGGNPAMCLRYGRAPRGQRAEAKVPRNRGANTTILAALTPQGLLEPMVVEGGTTIEVFLTFLDHFLCPTLRPGQVVLLDNLRVHKNRAVTDKIEATGAQVLFLPRYSPDFQPIEGAFSKLKAFLRRTAARTQVALEAAIANGLATVTTQDACSWFTHCGYPVKPHLS